MTRPLALVRRIVAEKRLFAGVAAVGLLAAAGLHVLAVQPLARGVEQASLRAASAAANLDAARERLRLALAAAESRRGMEAALRTFRQEVLPADLAGARALTFARLVALADEHGLSMERRAAATDREDGSGLARFRVSMRLSGAYPDIRGFIHAVETAPAFLVIEEIVLGQGDEAAGVVLGLDLSTYHGQGDDAQRREP